MIAQPRGPLMFDITGLELGAPDRERLAHPLAGGVILFARNYAEPRQLDALTAAIRAVRDPALLIAVDHEGGRVQRFRDGFTTIPPMRRLGERWDADASAAAEEAARVGATIAAELGAHGVDFSFAPVADLDYGASAVIGERAFHRNPNAVAHLAAALCAGLRSRGMSAVAKHFPGHGFVAADSHAATPVDLRPLAALEKDDLVPFGVLVRGGVQGVMPAHVIYRAVDAQPAGYSRVWLQDVLRHRLGFEGMVFSDDLSMAGAALAGDVLARAEAAYAAGCDMLLVCNDSSAVDDLLSSWRPRPAQELSRRCEAMEFRGAQ
jgi:beta-N-acetylhexosaminidase